MGSPISILIFLFQQTYVHFRFWRLLQVHVSMIFKMINAFGLLLTGRPFMQMRSGFKQGGQQKEKKDDEFDDYEELN